MQLLDESYTLKKLANGEDRLLCKGTFHAFPDAIGVYPIPTGSFHGTEGTYVVGLSLKISA